MAINVETIKAKFKSTVSLTHKGIRRAFLNVKLTPLGF
jgi:hypothetical protein